MSSKRHFLILIFPLFLSSCVLGGVSSSSSLSSSAKNSSSQDSSSLFSSSSASSSSSSSNVISSSSSSSSISSSSTSSSSSEPLDYRTEIAINSANPISFADGNGSFTSGNLSFSITNCEASSKGWFTLKQGGYLTNNIPYGLSFSTITVEYLRASDFGYLTARASSFPITSPENGAYEMTGALTFTFPGASDHTYFSLYAPVGTFVLTSIKLTGIPLDHSANSQIQNLDFYTINDTHGAAVETASSYEAGITRLSTFALTSERADPESTVFLSSGDMWQGSADSNLTYGQLMVNWMNIAGFESMAIGNHEFDWGYTHIVENAALANFPFLGINIVDPQGLRPSWAQPSKVVVRGGYKIGVIGAIGKLEGSIAVSSLGGFSFRSDYADLVRQEADRLRQEEDCSLVVLSIHNGSFDTTYCHNIDAVFEGHSHSNYKTTDSFNIPHVQTYANGSDFQHVRFSLVDGKFVFDSYSTVAFSTLSALDEEPMSLGVFGYYDGKNSAIKNEVVGHTASLLDESTLANYSVQCMYEYYCNSKWDSALALAVINYGGVRASIPAGDITYGQVYAALPFDNDNVFCSCTGDQVTSLKANSSLATYSTFNDFVSTQTYHVMVISYVSEKTQYSYLKEISRDAYRLRDIVADDFRRTLNA